MKLSYNTRIKICGITQLEDAVLATELGADALGFNFFHKSPRFISADKAREILIRLPPFISRVGIFANATVQEIQQILKSVPLDVLQFHGDEQEKDCLVFDKPYIKAIRMQPGIDITQICRDFPNASALLLDSYREGQLGGTGDTFSWKLIPDVCKKPIILAGGLNADNVEAALQQVHPYAVDVTSSVEKESGKKDPLKLRAFIHKVRLFSTQQSSL